MIEAIVVILRSIFYAGPEFWILGFASVGVVTVTLLAVRALYWLTSRAVDFLDGF